MADFGLLGDQPFLGLLGPNNRRPVQERFPLASAAAERFGNDPNFMFPGQQQGPQGLLGRLVNPTNPIAQGLGAAAQALSAQASADPSMTTFERLNAALSGFQGGIKQKQHEAVYSQLAAEGRIEELAAYALSIGDHETANRAAYLLQTQRMNAQAQQKRLQAVKYVDPRDGKTYFGSYDPEGGQILDQQGVPVMGAQPVPTGAESAAGQRVTVFDPSKGMDVLATYDKNTGQYTDQQGNPIQNAQPPRAQFDESAAQRSFSREQQMTNSYRAEIGKIEPSYRLSRNALAFADQARAGDGSAQVTILYGFIRALDPNSVVREGEVRLAQEAASLRQKAIGLAEKYAQGEAVVIPADMVDDIIDIMKRLNEDNEAQLQSIYDNYTERARRHGVDTESFRSAVQTGDPGRTDEGFTRPPPGGTK
jgi:hypothetical protein